jgi:hypothetical protein
LSADSSIPSSERPATSTAAANPSASPSADVKPLTVALTASMRCRTRGDDRLAFCRDVGRETLGLTSQTVDV